MLRLGVSMGSQNLEDTGPRFLKMEARLIHRETCPSATSVTMATLVVL